MERRFDEELEELKSRILRMAARVEVNLRDAFDGLLNRDPVLLQDVMRRDPEIDLLEIQIDEQCISLIALHQPVARDLRFVATTLKIVKDIERIGDTAGNLAQHSLAILEEEHLRIPPALVTMATAARHMLREALDAFVDKVQERVTGEVRLKLFKGACRTAGRKPAAARPAAADSRLLTVD